jgi:hypothetical protein
MRSNDALEKEALKKGLLNPPVVVALLRALAVAATRTAVFADVVAVE